MSTTGTNKSEADNEEFDFAAYQDAGLNAIEFAFGADLSKEAFGDINTQPGPLLWLANQVCQGVATLVETVGACYRRPKVN